MVVSTRDWSGAMTYQQEEDFLQTVDLTGDSSPPQDILLALNILLNRPCDDDEPMLAPEPW